jgi:oligopeptide/dipeptide ABC transporter ATP-binding protein
MPDEYVLEALNINTGFRTGHKFVEIVKDVSFRVKRGGIFAIVGESGCGKSVTIHSVCQLLPPNGTLKSGKIIFHTADGEDYRLHDLKPYCKTMRELRGKRLGMIFQDPSTSLNPLFRVGDQVAEKLLEHFKMSKRDAMEQVVTMFRDLSIPEAEQRIKDYPHQFSGGMRQRVMIAIAMICHPELLIADEPTTALDVTIQAQTIELMKKLQEQNNTSVILITHNMGLVAEIADAVAVMYMGRIVEQGAIEQIFRSPLHPYTKALLRSVPVPGMPLGAVLESIRGQTPNPEDCVTGCDFAERCGFASERCRSDVISDSEPEEGHLVKCLICSNGGR